MKTLNMNNVFIISQTRLKFVNALLFLVVISCFSSVTNADIETKKSLNSIVREYRDNASNWEAEIVKAANWLFWTLVAIDFAWLVLMMLFQKQDILDFLGSLIQRILIIGFFFILLTNGTTWASAITDSFRTIAGRASGSDGLSPSDVMSQGIDVALRVIAEASGAVNTIVAVAIAIIMAIIFALITAELIVVLISMYILLNAGIIMLAFGGSRWTEQFAINYYKTILAIGVKLFVILLMVGLGLSVIEDITDELSNEQGFGELFVIIASALVLYVLVKSIGSLVQSLISGSGDTSTGGTGALIGASLGFAGGAAAAAATVGEAATGAAKNTVGATMAVNSARNIASEGISDKGGQTAASRAFSAVGGAVAGSAGAKVGEALGLGLSKVAGTVVNLGKEAASDAGAKIKGESGADQGTMGGRMAQRMDNKSALKKMEKGSSDKSTYTSGVPPQNSQQ